MGVGLKHLNNMNVVGLFKNQYAGVDISLKHSSPVSINFHCGLTVPDDGYSKTLSFALN
jgi:hypothetical protein